MSEALTQMRQRALHWQDQPKFAVPKVLRGTQLSLRGLFLLVSFSGICCALATLSVLGAALLFLTAIALRTAVVDFTWRGDLATVLVMLCGASGTLLFIGMTVAHPS
jgi:hypothetical protein